MTKSETALFWILSLTWGLPMTILGAVIALTLIVKGYKPKRYYCFIYFEIGESWGGMEAGLFFFVNKNPSKHIKQHEAGHGLQNIVFGFLMPFVVSIPSAVRYWHREYLIKRKGYLKEMLPAYDSVWFERQATKLGEKHFT